MSASDTLKGVLALFKRADRWAKGFYAFNKRGDRISASHPDASCFCLRGAVQRAVGPSGGWASIDLAERFICQALAKPGERPEAVSIANWNDKPERTIKEVRAAVRKAHRLALDSERAAA